MVTALALKTKARSKKYKKARYAIENVSMKDLSNKIREFKFFSKVPYVKRIPKHEPTSSYFHLFVCLGECMMICGENNQHVHDGYEGEMASSSDVNDTNEDKSKNSIVHEPFNKPSSENIYMEVSKSECNTVNENLLQNNSSDIPTNVITELK